MTAGRRERDIVAGMRDFSCGKVGVAGGEAQSRSTREGSVPLPLGAPVR
jgi:hypothetical protein